MKDNGSNELTTIFEKSNGSKPTPASSLFMTSVRPSMIGEGANLEELFRSNNSTDAPSIF